MRNLLFPAVTLMNRLKYLQKFFLIGMLFMLPVGLSMYLIVVEIDKEIDFAKKERAGIEYFSGIRILLEHLQQHRGIANTILNGDTSFKEKLFTKQAQIEDDIKIIDQLDQRLGIRLKTTEQWLSIKEKWGNLEGKLFDLQPQESLVLHNKLIKENFELHTIIITDILSLFVHVGDTSNLKLDPGHDSFYLMDTMVNKLPLIIEKTGQSRGLGTGIAAKKTLTSDEKVQLIILSGMIQSAMNDVKSHMDLFENPHLKNLLQPYIQDNLNTTNLFLEVLKKEIIDATSIQIQSAKFYDIATTAIDSGFKLYDLESPILDNLLIERIHKLSKRKLVVMGLACIAFLLISYLFGAFYVSVIRTVTTLKRASVRFSGGDFSARVDLCTKDELQHVGNAFNKMVDSFANMMEERRCYEERIEYQAFYDALTGLPNRILFNDRLKLALSEAIRCRKMVAVMFLDLDRFKIINDTLGHDIGDLLLKAVTGKLSGCLRRRDTVSRMGGDEFLFILPDIGGIDQARVIAKKILDLLNQPILVGSHELFISASIGISLFPFDGEDIEHLVKNADTAMYVAKNNGRNSYQFYDSDMNAKAENSLQMENSLRRALERGEFLLYYQPRFDLVSGRITGMEALIRWQHPELGLVPPADFIPLAEELGLIIPIGEWVLRTACLQNKEWQEEGIRISVNISASQFQRDGFIDTVKKVIEETAMEPRWLELELTETVIMNNATMAIVKLKQLKELGIQISIDDFGTGFSSLSYLKHFPIDSLKIDRSFIKDIPKAPKDTAITKTILALGRRLGLKVVAEGVETEDQLVFLSSRRCNEVQGYLISRPLPADEAISLLRDKTMWNYNYFNRGVEGL